MGCCDYIRANKIFEKIKLGTYYVLLISMIALGVLILVNTFIIHPLHIKTTTCDIIECTSAQNTCYEQDCNFLGYSCKSYPYTCYEYNVTYSYLNDSNYKKIAKIDYNISHNYPMLCNNDKIACYYNNNKIKDTLNIIDNLSYKALDYFQIGCYLIALLMWIVILSSDIRKTLKEIRKTNNTAENECKLETVNLA